jgi:peptidoglycan/xylan/chitin deacetylase (PgdA/CDA1 family)
MKGTVKRLLANGSQVLGMDRLAKRRMPGRFVVLMFHRVVDAASYEASANKPLMVEEGIFHGMAATLARTCRCLSLPQAVAAARNGETSAKPVVVLTFDDGYGDFHDTVFPLLRRFNLPATMYLPTGFLDHPDHFFWWDAVEAFLITLRDDAMFAENALPEPLRREALAVAREPSPQKLENFIRGPLRRLGPVARERFLDLLPNHPAKRPAMLSWDQVRTMAASGLVDFGAHCVNHPYLDAVEPGLALEEVVTSKRRIEEETGQAVTSFAYPSGRVPSYYRNMLTQAKIGLAVTTRFGGNGAQSDPLLLRRVDARFCLAGETFDPVYFMAICSGCLDWLHGKKGA